MKMKRFRRVCQIFEQCLMVQDASCLYHDSRGLRRAAFRRERQSAGQSRAISSSVSLPQGVSKSNSPARATATPRSGKPTITIGAIFHRPFGGPFSAVSAPTYSSR